MSEAVTKEVTFHPKQYDAFNFDTQYAAVIAGVQSGKTFLGTYWAARMIAEHPKEDGLITAPTYKILHHATLPKFFENFPSYRRYYKEQKGVIALPDGTNIYCRSMDNPLGIEGMTIAWAWLDEAGQYPYLAWTVIRSRTSTTRGKVLITTTPYNMGWLYQNFYLPATRGEDKDMSVFAWRSVDSPYFPADFYEKEKKRLKNEEFRRRYEGEFTKMEGLVYDTSSWHYIDPIPSRDLRADITIGGIDWGWHNAAAVVVKIHDGHVYTVAAKYLHQKTTMDMAELCQQLQNEWGVNRWYADSANPEKIEEASTNTGLRIYPYEKSKKAIPSGISYILSLIKDNRMHIYNNLPEFKAEIETYHYPEPIEGKDTPDDPVHVDCDMLDAWRYALDGFRPAKQATPPEFETKEDRTLRMLNRKTALYEVEANKGSESYGESE